MTISVVLTISPPAHAAQPPIKASKAPIDITADQLDVFQEENRAVFTGRVVAIQEDTRLTSDRMIVHYRSDDEQKGERKESIRRIEVEGNVFLATPGETASGATGVYDVEKNEIRLNTGVVLTKDKNTLKGDHLVYDMSTGKSRLTTAEVQGEEVGGKGKKKRVRALFVPEDGDAPKQEETP